MISAKHREARADKWMDRCRWCHRQWSICADSGSCFNSCHLWHALAVLGERARGTCPYHRRKPPT